MKDKLKFKFLLIECPYFIFDNVLSMIVSKRCICEEKKRKNTRNLHKRLGISGLIICSEHDYDTHLKKTHPKFAL